MVVLVAGVALLPACKNNKTTQNTGPTPDRMAILPPESDPMLMPAEPAPAYRPSAYEPAMVPVAPVVSRRGEPAPEPVSLTLGSSRDVSPAPAPRRTTVSTPAPAPTAGKSSYTVQRGDTLWSIAQKNYGSGMKWKQIAAANPSIDPHKIRPGQVIAIP